MDSGTYSSIVVGTHRHRGVSRWKTFAFLVGAPGLSPTAARWSQVGVSKQGVASQTARICVIGVRCQKIANAPEAAGSAGIRHETITSKEADKIELPALSLDVCPV